ncbi:MAG: S8 family serine peptidase, partial [Longicatena sp.]
VEVLPSKEEITKPDTLPEIQEDGMKWDLRHKDLRTFDLRNNDSFSQVSYDLATLWPEQLPANFNPKSIMEIGKNPGLGIRALHTQGITGKGVNIAIIDQNLLLDHIEYKENIQMYETINSYEEKSASWHGPAVTSIAVGKTTGVAPDAKVYYIATSLSDLKKDSNGETVNDTNLSYMAKGIERVLEINKVLSEKDKIRVISISRGFSDLEKEDEKMVYDAIEKAKKENVLVITTSMEMNYGIGLFGLNRLPMGDGDDINTYSLGFRSNPNYISSYNAIYVPMDSRAYAGYTSNDDYTYGAVGGLSWTCPWLAGMYALCLQVNPNLTPDTFLSLANKTSTELSDENDSTKILKLNVVNPEALIEKVKAMK